LKHHAPVISICVIDRNYFPLPAPLDVQHERARAADMSGGHSVIICSEEQLKVSSNCLVRGSYGSILTFCLVSIYLVSMYLVSMYLVSIYLVSIYLVSMYLVSMYLVSMYADCHGSSVFAYLCCHAFMNAPFTAVIRLVALVWYRYHCLKS